ncbi:MAG: hypothetical protein ACXVC6_00195 [Bacteroidia bacterium]
MKKLALHIFLILFAINTFAQTDSVAYSGEMVLKDGLYFSYTDMRRNNPFPKEGIISNADKTELDFILKTLNDNQEISVAYNGQPEKVSTKKIWGFCQNNTVYINFQGKFYRIPVFGNISNFLGTVEVYNNYGSGFYGGVGVGMGMGYGGMMGSPMPVKQRETRQFIFDFYSGDIMDYTLENVEILISRDLKLYEEFMQLKKKKRRDMMMLYVRKYNVAHPVKFPVTS